MVVVMFVDVTGVVGVVGVVLALVMALVCINVCMFVCSAWLFGVIALLRASCIIMDWFSFCIITRRVGVVGVVVWMW